MSDPEEVPVRAGEVLAGKYRVERVLGVGGMGAVVAAIHMELEQRVALKFLLPSVADKPEVVSRFAREARAAAKIRSEHVAKVTDVGNLANGTPYIVMEYLDGRDLDAIITNDGPLPTSVAVDYVLQACVAIAEAHQVGIIHRDLKPANFFLARRDDGSAIIKVLDFGISKSLGGGPEGEKSGSLTKTSDVFGSPLYMSPEQLKSSRNVDARADQWALGIILFELMTGDSPFDRGTVAEIFGAILHEPPQRLRALVRAAPAGLEQIITRCLEKEPERRYANVAELANALAAFGSADAQISIQRITRMMQGGGSMNSIAPPSLRTERLSALPLMRSSGMPLDATAGTNHGPHAGSSTRTAWGAQDGVPKERSLGAVLAVLVVVMSAILGIALFFLVRPNPDALPPAPAAEPPRSSVTAAPPPAPSATPTALANDIPLDAPMIDPLILELADSTAPSATASGQVFKGRPKLGGPLPKKPVGKTSKEDPDGFGDRK